MKYRIIAIATMGIVLGACSSAPKSSDGKAAAKAAEAKEAPTAKDAKAATVAAKTAPKASAAASGSDVTCSYGDVKRQLKIVQSPEKCSVEYTKDGSMQEIGTGMPGSPYCGEVVERVKNNLTAAGYKCE